MQTSLNGVAEYKLKLVFRNIVYQTNDFPASIAS
jgi:hypothetical protein